MCLLFICSGALPDQAGQTLLGCRIFPEKYGTPTATQGLGPYNPKERAGRMKGLMIRWLMLSAAIIVASYMIDGIHVSGFFSACFAAAILGILNVFFRPILLILTLPINILTLGGFTFLINALMLKMVSGVIDGFNVYGFWSAIFGSIVISIVNWVLNTLINDRGRVEFYHAGKSYQFSRRHRPSNKSRKSDKSGRIDQIDLKKKDDDSWE